MATMIPDIPRDFDPRSHEGEIFAALDLLPSNYYVVHSFKNVRIDDNIMREGEADFVVFHPKKGILCIEAKAGKVKYENNTWKYASGRIMKHGGPYNQASSSKWNLFELIRNSRLKDIITRCKFLHAVWFPEVSSLDLVGIHFPAEADKNITLTMDDLTNPKDKIDKIFSIELENHVQTDLSDRDVKNLLRDVICPEFNIFPSLGFENDLKRIKFHRLLKEQSGILDYLTEQRTAVINGAAGTGKTMIAVEKAQRHAAAGEKVLFLCYNANLKTYLEEDHAADGIDYYTIAGFACKLCSTMKPDYKKAGEKLEDMYLTGMFPYMHVIVDEGQDFGYEDIEEADILQIVHDTIMDNDDVEGTFYVFYDRLQMVQGKEIPKYISDADCKLTLYKNCRNTENIAITSLKPITERNPKLYADAIKGVPARLHFGDGPENVAKRIDETISQLCEDGIDDVVILTCATEDKSILTEYVDRGKYKGKKFSTCRKFKGLEADAIILVDVVEDLFGEDKRLLFYVGSSRARLRLEMFTTMDEQECKNILTSKLNYKKKIKRAQRDLATELNAIPVLSL